MVNFLLIRFSSIGDIVLTTPVARLLKETFPDCKITFLTKKQFTFLLSDNPNIDKVLALDEDLKTTIASLKDMHFDYLIDLHHNLRTSRIKSALSIPDFTVDKLNVKKWLYVNFKLNYLPKRHIVDRYLDTLSVFDIENDKQGLDYFIPEKDIYSVHQHYPDFKLPYVVFVVGATYYTKQIPQSLAVDIMNKANCPFVLLGGPDDVEKSKEIEKELKVPFVNLCGQINLNQSASVIEQSKLVVSSDTGLMHIASAFHKTIISIWGNTVPEFGMTPYLPTSDSRIFENTDLKCRPCSKIGFDKCPKKHFKCMNELKPESIAQYINQIYVK